MASPRTGYDVLSEKLKQAKDKLIILNKNPNLTNAQKQQILSFDAVSTKIIKECNKKGEKLSLSELWGRVKPIIETLKAGFQKQNKVDVIDEVASLFETPDMQPIIMDLSSSEEEHKELSVGQDARGKVHRGSVMSTELDEDEKSEEEAQVNVYPSPMRSTELDEDEQSEEEAQVNVYLGLMRSTELDEDEKSEEEKIEKSPSHVMIHLKKDQSSSGSSYLLPNKSQKPKQVPFLSQNDINIGQEEIIGSPERESKVLQSDIEPQVEEEKNNDLVINALVKGVLQFVERYIDFIEAYIPTADNERRKNIMITLNTQLREIQNVIEKNKTTLDLNGLDSIVKAANSLPQDMEVAEAKIKVMGKEEMIPSLMSLWGKKVSITETFKEYNKEKASFTSLLKGLETELRNLAPRPKTP